MVVVAHDVHEVETLVHGWDVVGDVDGGGGGADGSRQEEAGAAGVEGRAEVLEWRKFEYFICFSLFFFGRNENLKFEFLVFLREMFI